jgi:hypothetical protein
MKLALALVALVTGCGGLAWDWEARAVVGAEAQRVPAAGREDVAWLSIRAEGGDVVYPVHLEGTDLVLDSPFVAGSLASRYDHYEGVVMRSGVLVVPLAARYPPPPPETYPADQDLRGRFALVLRDRAGVALGSESVDIAELIDPCGTTPITPLLHSIAGFVVQIFVQVSCQESIG